MDRFKSWFSSAVTIGKAAMKYPDGIEARVGDRVRIANGDTGTIVVSVDTDEFSEKFPQSNYSDLAKGILIFTDNGALVHLEEPDHSDLLTKE